MTRALDMVMSFLLSVKDGRPPARPAPLATGELASPTRNTPNAWAGRVDELERINSVISVPDHGLTSI
jgi:hypothetical protein